MKRSVIGFIMISVVGLFTEQIWAHDGGGASGRGFLGHHGGCQFSPSADQWRGFHGSFGRPGPHWGLTNRPFLPQGHGFARFDHFPHSQFFGPPLHFGQGGLVFRSFGFSHGGFAFNDRFGPAGPPPLGAPDHLPFAPLSTPPVVISSPFFCFPHGLGFTDQALFLDHLQRFHGIPAKNALAFCLPVGGGIRWIFFGF